MPIIPSVAPRRISQQEFGELSYEVMGHVFEIHSEFGRLFDEAIYKKELASRMDNVLLEVPAEVVHDSFSKTYYADVLVDGCGLFEFKAADAIHPRHRGQAIHYLQLFDLAHGKIVNVRPEQVQHEFVNCNRRACELTKPLYNVDHWDTSLVCADQLYNIVTELLADWGTGLDISLYEEALTHFLGGTSNVNVLVPVTGSSGIIGNQAMHLTSPDVAFRVTSFSRSEESFCLQIQRLLRHTPLKAMQWVNITNDQVNFFTIHS